MTYQQEREVDRLANNFISFVVLKPFKELRHTGQHFGGVTCGERVRTCWSLL